MCFPHGEAQRFCEFDHEALQSLQKCRLAWSVSWTPRIDSHRFRLPYQTSLKRATLARSLRIFHETVVIDGRVMLPAKHRAAKHPESGIKAHQMHTADNQTKG